MTLARINELASELIAAVKQEVESDSSAPGAMSDILESLSKMPEKLSVSIRREESPDEAGHHFLSACLFEDATEDGWPHKNVNWPDEVDHEPRCVVAISCDMNDSRFWTLLAGMLARNAR